ncbi:MAG: RNA polymerase sigma factor [Myxococcota bacterium]
MTAAARQRFQTLVTEFGVAIDRLCAGYERDDARAAELRQDVWLGVWRALPSFREEATWRTWVFRVAHNVASSHVRRRIRDRSTPVAHPSDDLAPDPQGSPERQRSNAERRERLRTAIAGLRPIDRQVILLYLEDLSQAEIADITGITRTNVSTRIGRIKAELTRTLQETSR